MKIALVFGSSYDQILMIKNWLTQLEYYIKSDIAVGITAINIFGCCGDNCTTEMNNLIAFDPDITFCYNLDFLNISMTGGDFFANQLFGHTVYFLDKSDANYSILSNRLNVTNHFFTESNDIYDQLIRLPFKPDSVYISSFTVRDIISKYPFLPQ